MKKNEKVDIARCNVTIPYFFDEHEPQAITNQRTNEPIVILTELFQWNKARIVLFISMLVVLMAMNTLD